MSMRIVLPGGSGFADACVLGDALDADVEVLGNELAGSLALTGCCGLVGMCMGAAAGGAVGRAGDMLAAGEGSMLAGCERVGSGATGVA